MLVAVLLSAPPTGIYPSSLPGRCSHATNAVVATDPTPVLPKLREALERELPGSAAAVLFEALGSYGPKVPKSPSEIVDFIGGALLGSLSRRCGAERAGEIVRSIESALRQPAIPKPDTPRSGKRSFDDEPTTTLQAVTGPISLVVLSTSDVLASRLSTLFDPMRVYVKAVRNSGELARAARSVEVAIIDASDLPPISPRAMATSLQRASVVLVWGIDLPEGEEVLRALDRAGVRSIAFACTDPVEPLLDVVRSRTA